MLTEQYEALRAQVVAHQASSGLRLGQGVLMARGLAAWMQVAAEGTSSWQTVPVASHELANVSPLVQKEVIAWMGEAVMTLLWGGRR